jgi:hypothetical protein
MPSMDLNPLGFRTARSVLDCGRAAFFGTADADLPVGRTGDVAADDRIPQFGYVGAAYANTRVLLFGINPGNGHQNDARSAGDARLMPALHRFVVERTPEAFIAAQAAYQTACQAWPVWKRHCAEVIGAGRLSLDDVAYSNGLRGARRANRTLRTLSPSGLRASAPTLSLMNCNPASSSR